MSSAKAPPQGSANQVAPADEFLNAIVPDFEMHDQTLVDGLRKLAKGRVPFAFGFEDVLKKNLTDPDTQKKTFDLELKNKTIREILDALSQADLRFTWSMDRATVNVFPHATIGDPSYLMNRSLQTFELKGATDVENGLLAIVRQLPPPAEEIAHAQVGGGYDSYPDEPWTVTYHNLTVRQIVNRLALHGGPCAFWFWSGATDFRAFAFFKSNLKCPVQNDSALNQSFKLSAAPAALDFFGSGRLRGSS